MLSISGFILVHRGKADINQLTFKVSNAIFGRYELISNPDGLSA